MHGRRDRAAGATKNLVPRVAPASWRATEPTVPGACGTICSPKGNPRADAAPEWSLACFGSFLLKEDSHFLARELYHVNMLWSGTQGVRGTLAFELLYVSRYSFREFRGLAI
jgi:hypothetical protein